MPKYHASLENAFAALADPTRRAVVEALSNGPATVSQLASPFAMALPSFTQHLGILERAGLVTSRREGRARICALNPQGLRAAEDWLALNRQQWEARLDRFEAHLANEGKDTDDGQEPAG
ncbi:helix-turn-helix transcriptional regulator [Paracoccus sp. S1E-3]|uniref:ArsR/SmtB family transcription factor n=1 Tax=Paracoccus sp. S1E-3 TaxID=2756130 RepID=UPI0015EF184F|nr:metalloregulator ArsR/SmtB family transcription factor [Paracoccus sp. S1E-3]MBA4492605.1 helix-turn-helix transcriptional regulator [Paracoccus sp. S1E-3]